MYEYKVLCTSYLVRVDYIVRCPILVVERRATGSYTGTSYIVHRTMYLVPCTMYLSALSVESAMYIVRVRIVELCNSRKHVDPSLGVTLGRKPTVFSRPPHYPLPTTRTLSRAHTRTHAHRRAHIRARKLRTQGNGTG